MDKQISTSVQYQFTNVYFFDAVFRGWGNFNRNLTKGDKYMRETLCLEWDRLKEDLEKNPQLLLKDKDKVVTPNDFNVTINYTNEGKIIFFFTFPDYEYNDAASKYVALALLEDMPRFFTLEYSEDHMTHQIKYVVGEFVIKDGKKQHKNYGFVDNDRLPYFAGFVLNILNNK